MLIKNLPYKITSASIAISYQNSYLCVDDKRSDDCDELLLFI